MFYNRQKPPAGRLLPVILLLRPQRYDRVLLCREGRRDESCEEGQQHRNGDQRRTGLPRQLCAERGNVGQMLYDRVDRQNQHQRQSHAKQSRNQTLDQRFGVEYPRDIVLRRADGAQNADLLCALQHGNICKIRLGPLVWSTP